MCFAVNVGKEREEFGVGGVAVLDLDAGGGRNEDDAVSSDEKHFALTLHHLDIIGSGKAEFGTEDGHRIEMVWCANGNGWQRCV